MYFKKEIVEVRIIKFKVTLSLCLVSPIKTCRGEAWGEVVNIQEIFSWLLGGDSFKLRPLHLWENYVTQCIVSCFCLTRNVKLLMRKSLATARNLIPAQRQLI
jgi:hypothetical protein